MKIAVALSGGVDSFLSLYLLAGQGHTLLAVHGLFLPDDKGAGPSPGLQKLCTSLGLELLVIDLRREFDEQIVKPFVEAYLNGLTPNPCVWCNKLIKFGLLWERIQALGVDRLATGHYACLHRQEDGRPALFKGRDPCKEQSYFLSLLSLEQLERIEFPLCSWQKNRVQAKVASLGLESFILPESQEVCFVPGDDYRSFLAGQIKDLPGPGPIVDSSGKQLGEHRGLHNYTLGQRRGLGIAYKEPLYVLHKEIDANCLVVGPRQEVGHRFCKVGEFNFLVPCHSWPQQVLVKLNYRQRARCAQAVCRTGEVEFFFAEQGQLATPGQLATVYDEHGQVLGGGIIVHGQ